ncbi:DUF5677 domain-containing protein [Bacillus thuringiensis]|uniref:DUF5677 domain-containing protein n=1 Tax=Bacillus thuringiensis TaxID=1428 RepID=UPI000BF9658E|nr:DUF5677 domain-containing protein [Bacillus thuringiensis]PFE12559.1 hypothetical protein CN303_11740 [Bacillus thuringiensis]
MESPLHILSKSIQFGEKFLKELDKRTDLELEHKIVASLFRKLIEQADAGYVLADHDLEGPLTVMKRSILETYLAIRYILQKEESVKDRAYSYYVGFLIDSNKDMRSWSKQQQVDMSDLEYERAIEINTEILKNPKFKYILQEWKKTKRKFKKPHDPNWYSLFKGPWSLKQLADRVMQKDHLLYLFYGALSQEAHSYKALEATNYIELMDKPLELKPIRCTVEPDDVISIKAFYTGAMIEVILYLFPNRSDECLEFAREIGMVPGKERSLTN